VLAHPELARLAARLAARPGRRVAADERVRYAAVAVTFRLDASGRPELLFIKRAEYADDPWSGHVAFPGGRAEPGDPSLAHTAARETLEETALDLTRDGRLVGELDEITPRTPRLPPIVIRPYVFAAAPAAPLVLSHEVAHAFWVPVDALRAPGASVTSVVRARDVELSVPSFLHGEYVIWGLTERILRQLLRLLG
jgi:8-oxo-dGTP pyrophosphatase MutT (NUDIX family)